MGRRSGRLEHAHDLDDTAKRRFRRSESFDHFMLFATDAVDKPKLPKNDSGQIPASNQGPALSQ